MSKKCIENTQPNEENICLDINPNECSKSESEINLDKFINSGGVDLSAKNYAKEFKYTNRHISLYKNDIYSIIFYKDIDCIEELSINMAKVNFGNCYNKVKDKIDPPTNDTIIIALVERSIVKGRSTISYSFYHPNTGEKIDAKTICKDEVIVEKKKCYESIK